MAKFAYALTAAPILGGLDVSIGANRIRERDDLALVSVAIPLDGRAQLASALTSAWGIALPEQPTLSSVSGDMRAVPIAPDQILLVFPHVGPDANDLVQGKLAGTGYTTDQTDAWVVLELSGPDVLGALERICPLDLASLPDGGSGRTVMEHMGALVIRLGPQQMLLLSASSSAASFAHAVETSFRNVVA